MHLLCVLMTRYFWKPSMSRRSSNEQQNRERRSGEHASGCVHSTEFKYTYSLVSHCPLWARRRMWHTSRRCRGLQCYPTPPGESRCRRPGRAASVSSSSHSVSGNDAELWAVFQKHITCGLGGVDSYSIICYYGAGCWWHFELLSCKLQNGCERCAVWDT